MRGHGHGGGPRGHRDLRRRPGGGLRVRGAGLAPDGARAEHVRPLPEGLTPAQGAALPLVTATAWHALADKAALEAGETVLIHSAAGGLGLAAIGVARALGAHVVATAGTEAKRAALREMGVEHVLNSRDLSWADEVHRITDGRGVDVVLNSLAGAAIERGLAVLAEDGRFIEVGKRDIYAARTVSLRSFAKGTSFAAVDVAGLITCRPARFARILDEVWRRVADGTLAPLPVTEHPFSDAADVLRSMARGEHTGKLVLTRPEQVASVAPEALPGGGCAPTPPIWSPAVWARWGCPSRSSSRTAGPAPWCCSAAPGRARPPNAASRNSGRGARRSPRSPSTSPTGRHWLHRPGRGARPTAAVARGVPRGGRARRRR